jgi:hypothetical protein
MDRARLDATASKTPRDLVRAAFCPRENQHCVKLRIA